MQQPETTQQCASSAAALFGCACTDLWSKLCRCLLSLSEHKNKSRKLTLVENCSQTGWIYDVGAGGLGRLIKSCSSSETQHCTEVTPSCIMHRAPLGLCCCSAPAVSSPPCRQYFHRKKREAFVRFTTGR